MATIAGLVRVVGGSTIGIEKGQPAGPNVLTNGRRNRPDKVVELQPQDPQTRQRVQLGGDKALEAVPCHTERLQKTQLLHVAAQRTRQLHIVQQQMPQIGLVEIQLFWYCTPYSVPVQTNIHCTHTHKQMLEWRFFSFRIGFFAPINKLT